MNELLYKKRKILLSLWGESLESLCGKANPNLYKAIPVGKIAEKAVCRSVFLITWQCILSILVILPTGMYLEQNIYRKSLLIYSKQRK